MSVGPRTVQHSKQAARQELAMVRRTALDSLLARQDTAGKWLAATGGVRHDLASTLWLDGRGGSVLCRVAQRRRGWRIQRGWRGCRGVRGRWRRRSHAAHRNPAHGQRVRRRGRAGGAAHRRDATRHDALRSGAHAPVGVARRRAPRFGGRAGGTGSLRSGVAHRPHQPWPL